MTPMKSVFSSHVHSIGYDPAARVLHVKFGNTGKTVVYEGVPPDVAMMVVGAPSIGEALHREVRGRFGYGYLKDG